MTVSLQYSSSRRRGFTLVELLVVITIIGILASLIVPAAMKATETARRAACANNMRQVGLALQMYEQANGRLPPGSAVMKYPAGDGKYMETWSMFAYLLPNLDQDALYSKLHVKPNYAPWEESAKGNVQTKWVEVARMAPIPVLKCPSARLADSAEELAPFPGFLGISTSAKVRGALTNFKGIGDSFRGGLGAKAYAIAGIKPSWEDEGDKKGKQSNNRDRAKGPPPPPNRDGHPDGVFFPTAPSNALRSADISDGATYTIFMAETIEPLYARWMIGSECTLAGMPSLAEDPINGVVIEKITIPAFGTLWAPKGFDGKFGEESAISPDFQTYMGYDYTLDDKWYDRTTDDTAQIKYGASSRHGTVVNHLMGDSRVQPFAKNMDVALYYFLITRDHNEAFPSSESARWATAGQ